MGFTLTGDGGETKTDGPEALQGMRTVSYTGFDTIAGRSEARVDVVRLHRNNAAEWAMVIGLTPLAWTVRVVAWVWGRHRSNKVTR